MRVETRYAGSAVAAVMIAAPPCLASADDGIHATLEPRGGLVVADDRHAPGQTEGTFVALAYGVDGAVDVTRGRHTFSASVHVLEALGVTIVVPDAVKAADDARASLRYSFQIAPWLGLAGWTRAELPLFGSGTPRADVQPFLIQRVDGRRELRAATSLPLTQPFAPFFLSEGVGLEAKPVRASFLTLGATLGLTGEHAFAKGQLSVHDNPHTRVIDVTELESYHALSPLAGLALAGHIAKRLAYAGDVEVRFPLVHTDTVIANGISLGALTEVDSRHSLRIELQPWLTVDYELFVGVRPLLDSGVRIQNRLMLSGRPGSLP